MKRHVADAVEEERAAPRRRSPRTRVKPEVRAALELLLVEFPELYSIVLEHGRGVSSVMRFGSRPETRVWAETHGVVPEYGHNSDLPYQLTALANKIRFMDR